MAQLFELPIKLSFESPQYLYSLVVIPLIILIYLGSLNYKKRRSINFPNFEALQRTGLTEMHSKNIFYLYVFLIISLLLTLALCGMNLVFTANTDDFSYVIAIDNSQSMQAEDLSPNRLEASKEAAKKFISDLPMGVKVGLISFSGEVVIISETDTSKIALEEKINSIKFSQVSGTNINDAIIATEQILKKEKIKAMIILSDGQINIGNISETIDYAKEKEITINTIALGTEEGGITQLGFNSKTDIEILKAMAFNTNGKFFSIENSKDISIPFNEIMKNTKKEITLETRDHLLLASLILLILFWISYNFRFKNFP